MIGPVARGLSGCLCKGLLPGSRAPEPVVCSRSAWCVRRVLPFLVYGVRVVASKSDRRACALSVVRWLAHVRPPALLSRLCMRIPKGMLPLGLLVAVVRRGVAGVSWGVPSRAECWVVGLVPLLLVLGLACPVIRIRFHSGSRCHALPTRPRSALPHGSRVETVPVVSLELRVCVPSRVPQLIGSLPVGGHLLADKTHDTNKDAPTNRRTNPRCRCVPAICLGLIYVTRALAS